MAQAKSGNEEIKMAIKKVIEHPAQVLSTPCAEVTEINDELITLLDDLYDTMVEYDGVGIAAPKLKHVTVKDVFMN